MSTPTRGNRGQKRHREPRAAAAYRIIAEILNLLDPDDRWVVLRSLASLYRARQRQAARRG